MKLKVISITAAACVVAVGTVILNWQPKTEELGTQLTSDDHLLPKAVSDHSATVAKHIDDISPGILFITGLDHDSTRYVERNRMVNRLDFKKIQEVDLLALINFLDQKPPGEGTQLAFHSLKNDIMSHLIDTGRYQGHLAHKMIQDMTNDQTHPVWREYIAQYIPDLIAAIDLNDVQNVKQIDALIDALWQVSEEPIGALAGSAILGLHELSKDLAQIDSKRLNELIADMALSSNFEPASRMGAVDLLRQEKNRESLPTLKELCFDDAESTTLRMAAINAAYHLSDQDEIFKQELRAMNHNEDLDSRLQTVIKKLVK